MKGKLTSHILMVSAAVALAAVASGQAVQAGGAAQGAIPQVPPSPPPAIPPAPPTLPPAPPANPLAQPPVSAGTAAGASSGVAGSVNSPVNRPDVGASTTTGAGSQTGAGTTVSPDRIDADASNRVNVDSGVNRTGATSTVMGESSASLRTADTVQAIQASGFALRDQATTSVQARLDATNNLIGELRTRAEAAGDQSKAAFARALTQVRQREQDVRANLRDAARATNENWGRLQSELAANYSAYAKAVAEAEVAARATK